MHACFVSRTCIYCENKPLHCVSLIYCNLIFNSLSFQVEDRGGEELDAELQGNLFTVSKYKAMHIGSNNPCFTDTLIGSYLAVADQDSGAVIDSMRKMST